MKVRGDKFAKLKQFFIGILTVYRGLKFKRAWPLFSIYAIYVCLVLLL